MDLEATIGIAAAPLIVSGVLGSLNFVIDRYLTGDAKRLIALLLGVLYTFVAWQAGVIDVENGWAAALLGLSVGLGAMGANATYRRVVAERPPPPEA